LTIKPIPWIGAIHVYSFGLMMALGFLAANAVVARECRRKDLTSEFAASLVIWTTISGLVGRRIYYILDNLHAYRAGPTGLILSGSGFVWYGALIGGLLGCYLVARYYKVPTMKVADVAAPAAAIGQAVGRVGCFLSGDGDWGIPTKLPIGVAFPHAIVGWNARTVLTLDRAGNLIPDFYTGVKVHPAMLYEAGLYALVFAILWSLRGRLKINGQIAYVYLILAGASRFAVEFVRINPRVLGDLSEAQLISVMMIIAGTVGWYWSRVTLSAATISGLGKTEHATV
jgi:phosphatidylglycerol:prolipoprotein diacylglycerol transferase